MRDGLPPNAFQAFDRAARAGSFAAAVLELGVAPTAISQHIRLLEGRFGKQVFLRRANGVELTDAGRELFPRVAGAFSGLTEGAAHLKTSVSRPRAALSVIASVGELWPLPRLADLADRAGVRIIGENQNPIDFAGRGADIRITYGAAACPGHMVELLFRDRMGPVAAPLLAAGLRGARLVPATGA
jgi:DNA-binding transcriptional LysR family regulator